LGYWRERLAAAGVAPGAEAERFGETALAFTDPHGLPLAVIETATERPFVAWPDSPVPVECQLRGMHSVRLWERDLANTEFLLTQLMGFRATRWKTARPAS
jgi:glyoxalase family protein